MRNQSLLQWNRSRANSEFYCLVSNCRMLRCREWNSLHFLFCLFSSNNEDDAHTQPYKPTNDAKMLRFAIRFCFVIFNFPFSAPSNAIVCLLWCAFQFAFGAATQWKNVFLIFLFLEFSFGNTLNCFHFAQAKHTNICDWITPWHSFTARMWRREREKERDNLFSTNEFDDILCFCYYYFLIHFIIWFFSLFTGFGILDKTTNLLTLKAKTFFLLVDSVICVFCHNTTTHTVCMCIVWLNYSLLFLCIVMFMCLVRASERIRNTFVPLCVCGHVWDDNIHFRRFCRRHSMSMSGDYYVDVDSMVNKTYLCWVLTSSWWCVVFFFSEYVIIVANRIAVAVYVVWYMIVCRRSRSRSVLALLWIDSNSLLTDWLFVWNRQRFCDAIHNHHKQKLVSIDWRANFVVR